MLDTVTKKRLHCTNDCNNSTVMLHLCLQFTDTVELCKFAHQAVSETKYQKIHFAWESPKYYL